MFMLSSSLMSACAGMDIGTFEVCCVHFVRFVSDVMATNRVLCVDVCCKCD